MHGQVHKPIFVEPATARISPLAEGLYTDIEAVWNHHNYWLPVPSALPAAHFADPGAFSLDSLSSWARLLEGPAHQVLPAQQPVVLSSQVLLRPRRVATMHALL